MKKMIFSNLKNVKRIHMIGIGGISMSAIALMLKKNGYEIKGSDKTRGDMIEILEKNDIPVYIGSNAELVKDADIVVYTSAISQHDPEYIKAKSLNIPTYERGKFLGMLLSEYSKTICIAGTHGKTTTTSMISSILIDAGCDPNVQVGSKFKKLGDLNYRIGDSDYFVLESCEYVDNFLNFPHQTAVILNVDNDHLDYFSNIEEIKKSFKKFILMLPKNGILVINKDNKNCMDILNEIENELKENSINIYTFSLNDPTASLYAKDISNDSDGFYTYTVTNPDTKKDYTFSLTIPGIHNIYDSLAAIATCYAHGINFEIMQKSLHEFCGARRRFEFKKDLGNHIRVYDDYAHHPTEIKATLAAAKQKNHNKIIAIFQPHTYSRTKNLLDDFSNAFYDADIVIIADIYAAREKNDGTISSQDLVNKLKKNNVNATYISNFEDIVKYVKEKMEPNDIVLTIGAGDITKVSNIL